jgi:ATP-dependent DNA helicase RecQ
VLRGEQPVRLRTDTVARAGAGRKRKAAPGTGAGRSRAAAAADLAEADREVFERLRAWRAETARAAAVPAYVVFGDATLAGIAQLRPATAEALLEVSGVGAAKLANYGEAVLAVVAGPGNGG